MSGGAVIGLALLIVVVLHSAVVPGRYALRGARMLTGVWDHDRYHSTFTAGGFERWDHVLAARWIEENTPQDAQIALYTNTSLIAWLSRRETPFRLAGWRFPMHEAAGSSPWQRYRDEYMSDLRRTRPDVIVVQTRAGQSGLPLDEMRLLVEFPELRDFLETHYHRAHVLSTLAVFRKIPPAGGNGVEPGPSAPTGLSAASPRRAPG